MSIALDPEMTLPEIRPRFSFHSIQAKLLAIVGLGIFIGYGAMIVASHTAQEHHFRAMAYEVNRTLTDLMADQASAGIIERDEDQIERIYFDIVFGDRTDHDHSDIAALGVFGSDGRRVKSYLSLDDLHFPEQALARLSEKASSTGIRQETWIEDWHVVVSPIARSKYNKESIGAFAIAWSTHRIDEQLAGDARLKATIAAVFGVLTFLLLGLVLHRYVVAPIRQLTDDTVTIGQTGSLRKSSWPSLTRRSDELGILSRQFDLMVEKLADAQSKLLDQSYYGGMAEMAAGVLHNVRNALSPISIGLWKVTAAIETPVSENLKRALDELANEQVAPERRLKLAEFVRQCFVLQLDQRQAAVADLHALVDQTRHIEQILQDHSLFAKERRQLEPVSLSEVLKEAAQIVGKSSSALQIAIDPGIEELPAIHGHRIILTQVIGNLIVNAAQSIKAAEIPDGKIEISADLDRMAQKDALHIVVSDNGMGIDGAILGRLFERGFSTKNPGGGGLGLHWSANCLSSMGGRIYAESDGPGRGARFHIVIPTWESDGDQN